jgi:2-amino-4-hydroxy-6-hydroxymethyldihydropteridine diphosphokinase
MPDRPGLADAADGGGPAAVATENKPTRAYVGLGANLDEPRAQVEQAVEELAALRSVALLAVSPLYRSRPMGPRDQPDFINAVAGLDARCDAAELLARLHKLEARHGRQRDGARWGPRPLDLDLLLFGRERIDTPALTVPHPGLAERNFVLYPLADIAPLDLDVPGFGPLGALLARVAPDGIQRIERDR